jgi:hypothetical protein
VNITDETTEHKVIAALLTEPDFLAAASDLETQDFTDYRYWVIFAAVRQLQSEGADVDVLEVDRLLEQRDARFGSFLRPQCGAAFLGELVLDAAPYRGERVLWEHDLWWLRELRRRREALEDVQ